MNIMTVIIAVLYGIAIGTREDMNTQERYSPVPVVGSNAYHNWRMIEWLSVAFFLAVPRTIFIAAGSFLFAWAIYEMTLAVKTPGRTLFLSNPTPLKMFGLSIVIPWWLPFVAITVGSILVFCER